MPTVYLLDGNMITAMIQSNPFVQQYLDALLPDDERITCFVVIAEWEHGILNAPTRQLRQEIREQSEPIFAGFYRVMESSPEIDLE